MKKLGLFALFAGLSLTLLYGQEAKVKIEIVNLTAEDGGRLRGFLYWPEGRSPKTAIVNMHPNGDNTQHFTLAPVAAAGFAAFGLAGRYVNSIYRDGIHENLLLDLAAAIKHLREQRGIAHVVLVGHSGGGSLMAFYQAQATTPPPGRLRETPAGDPPDLNRYDMPPAQGLITMNAAEGEGLHMAHHLDPSIIDENDPLSIDPSLDMYNPANGFRIPPEPSKYSEEFQRRFRKAQQERAARLDALARSYIAEQNYYKRLMQRDDFKQRPLEEQIFIQRRAVLGRWMMIYRTEADLRYTDLSIDPSDRVVGSNYTFRPDLRNYSEEARLRYIAPRSYLSTMSPISSRARLWDNIAKVTVPTLVIGGTADRGIFPSHIKKTFEASAARDKKLVWVEGADHGFNPSGPKAGKGDQRQRTIEAIISWLKDRFPN